LVPADQRAQLVSTTRAGPLEARWESQSTFGTAGLHSSSHQQIPFSESSSGVSLGAVRFAILSNKSLGHSFKLEFQKSNDLLVEYVLNISWMYLYYKINSLSI
jgi:hypothetical protein